MWHAWGREELFVGFRWGKPQRKRQCGKPRHRGEIILKFTLEKPVRNAYGLDRFGSGEGE
jgi:hypothetical protein